jgi:hypothetical protein
LVGWWYWLIMVKLFAGVNTFCKIFAIIFPALIQALFEQCQPIH